MVDWDGDGDLDLLFGGFDGSLSSASTRARAQKPAFATSEHRGAGRRQARRDPGGRTARRSSSTGTATAAGTSSPAPPRAAVYWFRNVGKPGRPEFAAAVELVPKHEGIGYAEFLDAGEEPGPGIRSQIAVADYNGDGKLDLLLGDFCTYLEPRADLTEKERVELADLRAKQARLEPAVAAQGEKLQEELKVFWKPYGIKEQLTAEVQAKYREKVDEIHARPDVKTLDDEAEAVKAAMKRFLKPAGPGALGGGQDTPHGYVWLFLRK